MAYKTATEVAKDIRAVLKKEFPNVKFSVRQGSGGGSINVKWENFPPESVVKEVVKPHESVDRDDVTGEILAGGNLFVFCDNTWTADVKKEIEERMPQTEDRIAYFHWFNKKAKELYEEKKAAANALTTERLAK